LHVEELKLHFSAVNMILSFKNLKYMWNLNGHTNPTSKHSDSISFKIFFCFLLKIWVSQGLFFSWIGQGHLYKKTRSYEVKVI